MSTGTDVRGTETTAEKRKKYDEWAKELGATLKVQLENAKKLDKRTIKVNKSKAPPEVQKLRALIKLNSEVNKLIDKFDSSADKPFFIQEVARLRLKHMDCERLVNAISTDKTPQVGKIDEATRSLTELQSLTNKAIESQESTETLSSDVEDLIENAHRIYLLYKPVFIKDLKTKELEEVTRLWEGAVERQRPLLQTASQAVTSGNPKPLATAKQELTKSNGELENIGKVAEQYMSKLGPGEREKLNAAAWERKLKEFDQIEAQYLELHIEKLGDTPRRTAFDPIAKRFHQSTPESLEFSKRMENANIVIQEARNLLNQELVKINNKRKELRSALNSLNLDLLAKKIFGVIEQSQTLVFHGQSPRMLMTRLQEEAEQLKCFLQAANLDVLETAIFKARALKQRSNLLLTITGDSSPQLEKQSNVLKEMWEMLRNKALSKFRPEPRLILQGRMEPWVNAVMSGQGNKLESGGEFAEAIDFWKIDCLKEIKLAEQMRESQQILEKQYKVFEKELKTLESQRHKFADENSLKDKRERLGESIKKKLGKSFNPEFETGIESEFEAIKREASPWPETSEKLQEVLGRLTGLARKIVEMNQNPWPGVKESALFDAAHEDRMRQFDTFMEEHQRAVTETKELLKVIDNKRDKMVVENLLKDAEQLAKSTVKSQGNDFSDCYRRLRLARAAAEDMNAHPLGSAPSKDLASSIERWQKSIEATKAGVYSLAREAQTLKKIYDLNSQSQDGVERLYEAIVEFRNNVLTGNEFAAAKTNLVDSKGDNKTRKRHRETALEEVRRLRVLLDSYPMIKNFIDNPLNVPVPLKHALFALSSMELNIQLAAKSE